jgi:hypothetical protein
MPIVAHVRDMKSHQPRRQSQIILERPEPTGVTEVLFGRT